MITGFHRFFTFILLFLSSSPVVNCLYASHDEQPAKNPVIVCAHGLRNNTTKFKAFLDESLFAGCSLYGRSGPEIIDDALDPKGDGLDRSKIVFGQKQDIERLILACSDALAEHDDPVIIGFGYSKGSATWLNTLAFLSTSDDEKHKKILSCIKAVVVFAPFADIFESQILAPKLLNKYIVPFAKRAKVPDYRGVGRKLFGWYAKKYCPLYDIRGVHPIKSVLHISPNIPIFIVHSTKDEIIPVNHSRNIYLKLLKDPHRLANKNTYFLEFDGGPYPRSAHSDSFFRCDEWHKPVYDFLAAQGLHIHKDPYRDYKDVSYLQPSREAIQGKIFKHSTVPSIMYGIFLACGIEGLRYLKYAFFDKKETHDVKYSTTFKRSLKFGGAFALGLEAIHFIRKKRIA